MRTAVERSQHNALFEPAGWNDRFLRVPAGASPGPFFLRRRASAAARLAVVAILEASSGNDGRAHRGRPAAVGSDLGAICSSAEAADADGRRLLLASLPSLAPEQKARYHAVVISTAQALRREGVAAVSALAIRTI